MSGIHAPSLRANDTSDSEFHPFGMFAVDSRNLASWLTSMLFHMILLLVLAFLVLGTSRIQPTSELTIAAIEPESSVPMEALDNLPLIEPPDAKLPPEFVGELVPIEIEDEKPESIINSLPTDERLLPILNPGDCGATVRDGPIIDVLPEYGPLGPPQDRMARRKEMVGNPDGPTAVCEKAVEAALEWLATHQNRNGSWSFDHTQGDRCSGFANPGDKRSRMGATGLALLPFLGAGYTHKDGKFRDTVSKGLKYLVGNMQVARSAGRLFEKNGASHEHMYCHGIAACALAEAYGMTQDPKLRAPAQLSLNYIVQAQHPTKGGWLYTPRAGGDTSVVGWQVMALKSGILSYLQVPGSVKTLTTRWLDAVQSELPPGGYGIGSRYGYRNAGDRNDGSAACTAIGLLCRNYLGTKKDDPGLRKGVRWIAEQGPHASDMYYNYYGSMVMFQNDEPRGALWTQWNTVIRNQLVTAQVQQGSDRGSWHFTGNHGSSGGRLYNTALACMTLEVPYRYLPIYQQSNVQQDNFPLE